TSLLLISGVWATLRLLNTREIPSDSYNEDNEKWGFGQVMPVVLLAAPLVPVVEATIRTCLYRDGKVITKGSVSLARGRCPNCSRPGALDLNKSLYMIITRFKTTNDLSDQAPLFGIPIAPLDPPTESDAETQNDSLLLTSLPVAPLQEFEHECQTDPVRAEIKRLIDRDRLLNHETMILATMLPQTGGLLFASWLLVAGTFVRFFRPGIGGGNKSAHVTFSLIVMPSMCSGYMWISLFYLSFWTNTREGRLKRTIVWFLCLFWTLTYGSLFAAIPLFDRSVGVAAAFGPFGLAILVALVYTPFRLRGLRGMG
ncbi:unnamed protein product, partial [Clonostachys rhizophaga]